MKQDLSSKVLKHHPLSTKMTFFETFQTVDENTAYLNLQDKKEKRKLKNKQSDLFKTADSNRDFEKADATNWSNKIYTITENLHDTSFSYPGNL